ncbi:MAG TPA: glycosyltransferase, partial [Spirochaeta sp.]|nr:glycosyltransferase [Spirochaeta sp.]
MLSIIVPVYNGKCRLTELVERICSCLTEIIDDWELIFVDDGSTDGSLDLIKQLARHNSKIGWLSFAHNAGQQIAVLCGLRESRGDLIVTMDDDLEHPPEMISDLINEL